MSVFLLTRSMRVKYFSFSFSISSFCACSSVVGLDIGPRVLFNLIFLVARVFVDLRQIDVTIRGH